MICYDLIWFDVGSRLGCSVAVSCVQAPLPDILVDALISAAFPPGNDGQKSTCGDLWQYSFGKSICSTHQSKTYGETTMSQLSPANSATQVLHLAESSWKALAHELFWEGMPLSVCRRLLAKMMLESSGVQETQLGDWFVVEEFNICPGIELPLLCSIYYMCNT